MKKIYIIFLALFLFLIPSICFAQEEVSYKGKVIESKQVACSDVLNDEYTCFEYIVEIEQLGEEKTTIPILSEDGQPKFTNGDKVYITQMSDMESELWSITGFNRNTPIIVLISLFCFLAILIGKKQGLGSLISLALTVVILYLWAIPKILAGGDVIFIGVVSVLITLVIILYASHGFTKKSSIGVLSTAIGIVIVGILAKLFSNYIRVDGSGSEEAFLLLSQTNGSVNLSDVFFISILIGAMGVLDDVVMSQISAIVELYRANSNLNTIQLFKRAMNIGRDHISSMVNTLFIAYAGSSIAVVMLLTYTNDGIGNIIKIDVIAEEIVRTITSSIGILLVVPISSIIAAKLIPLSIRKGDSL